MPFSMNSSETTVLSLTFENTDDLNYDLLKNNKEKMDKFI